MLGEGILDRTRVNIFSAGDDHVVFAPVHHVADDVFGPAAGIGVEGQVAAAEDAAGDVRPNGSVVLIEDDNRAAGNRPADRLRCFAQVGRRRESANADLRGP